MENIKIKSYEVVLCSQLIGSKSITNRFKHPRTKSKATAVAKGFIKTCPTTEDRFAFIIAYKQIAVYKRTHSQNKGEKYAQVAVLGKTIRRA
jgi:hypothetical protein